MPTGTQDSTSVVDLKNELLTLTSPYNQAFTGTITRLLPTDRSMSLNKKFFKQALNPIVRAQALRRLESVAEIDNPLARSIAEAIHETVSRSVSPEESTWIERIETLRSNLAQSSAKVPFIDFGAGSHDEQRSEAEMLAGVRKSITIADACRASKAPSWCLLLFKLIRKLKPNSVVELGTCVGISAAYQAAAQSLNGHGRLYTHEGSPSLASLSQDNLRSLDLNNATVVPGRFFDTLNATINSLERIDYAFIDGHHDELATIAYFEELSKHMPDNSLAIFDDISWSDGMRRAWQSLEQHPNVSLSLDLRTIGICVINHAHDKPRQRVQMSLPD